MPTYNVAPWVDEAIQSVLKQTYRDFELLVIDDCSTDDTVSVVRSIDDPRIRIIQNEKNVGLAENLNRGLSHISTEYVARMDGDDIAEPFWLEREVAVLDSHPEIGICSAGFERFGTVKSLVRFPERHEDCMANMLFECSVIVPTFRMSLYRDHGLRYSSEAFPAEDYRFWAECLRVTRVYNIQARRTATQGGTGATLYARLAEHRLHRRGEAILYRELHGSADSLATRLQREENLLPENDRKEPQRGSFRRGGVAQAA